MYLFLIFPHKPAPPSICPISINGEDTVQSLRPKTWESSWTLSETSHLVYPSTKPVDHIFKTYPESNTNLCHPCPKSPPGFDNSFLSDFPAFSLDLLGSIFNAAATVILFHLFWFMSLKSLYFIWQFPSLLFFSLSCHQFVRVTKSFTYKMPHILDVADCLLQVPDTHSSDPCISLNWWSHVPISRQEHFSSGARHFPTQCIRRPIVAGCHSVCARLLSGISLIPPLYFPIIFSPSGCCPDLLFH